MTLLAINTLDSSKGMTIKELVIVLFIIMAMTLGSVPLFFKLRCLSREKAFNNTSEGIQQALVSWSIRQELLKQEPFYPEFLDNNPLGPCLNCFEKVFEKGIEDSLWYKVDSHTYLFSVSGKTKNKDDFLNQGNLKLEYKASTGKITTRKL